MYILEYKTKEELIDILKSRGMEVSCPKILDNINYSHLIYKYGEFFLDKNIKHKIQYKTGVDIIQLYNLYLFNAELSSKLFNVFNKIEHSIRSSIVQHISKEHPIGYLEKDFYTWIGRDFVKTNKEKEKFIKSLSKTEKKKRSKYSENHLIGGILPIWLLIDEVPIGQLRMFMKLCRINKEVLKDIKISSRNLWMLNTFNIYRNDCAHMEILKGKSGNAQLSDLLGYIRRIYPEDYKNIMLYLEEYDFSLIKLDKEEYFKTLGFLK